MLAQVFFFGICAQKDYEIKFDFKVGEVIEANRTESTS
jgi:hypothetical protein